MIFWYPKHVTHRYLQAMHVITGCLLFVVFFLSTSFSTYFIMVGLVNISTRYIPKSAVEILWAAHLTSSPDHKGEGRKEAVV
jgi:hypothetical protein